MKKIIVIGCPGSGKSTFSKALHRLTGLPLVHLDRLYWNADKTTVDKMVFNERLSNVLQQSEWIIDGDYASTMEQRLQACDTVVFLDYPTEVCLEGIEARKGQPRSDMPWVESGPTDTALLERVTAYRSHSRPRVLALLERYSDKTIHVFSDRAQAQAFLTQGQP